MMAAKHLSYIVAGLEPFTPVAGNKLTYRKELIYAGHFFKRNEQEFKVTRDTIEGWADTGNLMLSNGVSIPWFKEHNDSDNKRAETVKFIAGVDSKGRPALYADVKFTDRKTAEKALHNNVSIYSEPKYRDGLGNEYDWPITHVAITSFPVIPALEPYTAIAASLLKGKKMPRTKVSPEPKKAVKKRTIDDTLKQLGITVPKDADDKAKKKLLKGAVGDFLGPEDDEDDDEETEDDDEELNVEPPSKKKGKKGKKETPAIAASMSPIILKQVTKARKTELENLVREFKITPAVRDSLAKKYCSDAKVTLALSNDVGDDFDDLIAALSKNEPYNKGEQTHGQTVALSSTLVDPENNSLVAKARKRREAAEKKNGRR